MATKKTFEYGATFIAFLMLVLVVLYIIMIYPTERADILGGNFRTEDVKMEGLSFSPNIIEVKANTKVVWKNRDDVIHTVSFADFNSGLLDPGESYSHTFRESGTYDYSSEFYPSMVGTVVVR